MRRWAYVTATLGTISAAASCSATPPNAEITSSVSQAAGAQYQPATAARVCQLIGDTDYAARPSVVPTKSRTIQTAGVIGTDLGFPVPIEVNGIPQILFYFGDTNFDGKAFDAQGFTSDVHLPPDGCPLLQFNGSYSGGSGSLITTVDGEPRGVFQVPQGGVFDPGSGQVYVFYSITDGDEPRPDGLPFSRSVLTVANATTPNDLQSVRTSPFNGAGLTNFYINSPIIISAAKLPNSPFVNVNPQESLLLVYGSSQPYRQGSVQLAAVPLASVADASAYRYKTYTSIAPSGWTGDPASARPIFDDESPPCAGEMSVTYNAIFDVYMMSYVCGSPQNGLFSNTPNTGAFLRLASSPAGPWSPPTIMFDPVRDQALGLYMHAGNARAVQGQGGLMRTPDDTCSPDNGSDYCCVEPAVSMSNACLPPPQGQGAAATPPPPRLPPPPACITGYKNQPSWCPSLAGEENSSTAPPGCCTDQSACCDLAFTSSTDGALSSAGFTLWGSAQPGGDYAPYLIQPYSQPTAYIPNSSVPIQQDLYYALSTWNPYVVDLMKSTVANNDPDDDGVPTFGPDGKTPIDNCPLAYNPGQANCNMEAESAWNANHSTQPVPILGDVCDPVPCPLANTDTATSGGGPCVGVSRYVEQICRGREIHDQIDVTAVGSSAIQGPGAVARETPPSYEVTSPTRERFCEANPFVSCTNAAVIRDAQLTSYGSDVAERFDPANPWHRITLKQGSVSSVRTDAVEFSFQYGGEPGLMTWDYADDNTFWTKTSPFANVIGSPGAAYPDCATSSVPGTCLIGRLWLHADTDVGATIPTADGSNVGIHGTELANYYFDVEPDKPVFSVSFAVGNPRHSIPQFLYRDAPDPPLGERVGVGPDWKIFDRGNAIPILIDEARVFGLRQSGALVDASASFGTSFTRELIAGTSWTDAPGPSTAGVTPMAIAMSADGTNIAGTATLSGTRVLLGRQADLTAQLGAGSDRTTDAEENFGAVVNATIPIEVDVVAGNGGTGQVVLSFETIGGGNVTTDSTQAAAQQDNDSHWHHERQIIQGSTIQCVYTGGASQSHPTTPEDRVSGMKYLFSSCSSGAQSGDTLAFFSAKLHVASGDPLAGSTQVEVGIAATETDSSPLSLNEGPCPGNASSLPRPRIGFTATYAPTLGGVFLVGGESRWREPLSDIWFKPLVGAWQQIKIPEGTLGRVIDAAFAPADGRLWVIDEAPATARPVGHWSCHGQPTIRLLRIERETGALRVVASATPHGVYDNRGLTVDRDGQILLYASSNAANVHRVARLVPDANDFDALITSRDKGALVAPPAVDYHGYAFVEVSQQHPQTSGNPTMERRASLTFAPATLDTWTSLLQ